MSMNQPGYEKDNAITRMARNVANLNAAYGSRAQGGGVPREMLGSLGVDPGPAPPPAPANVLPNIMASGTNDRGEGGLTNAALDPDEARRREEAWAAATGQKVGGLATEVDESESGYAPPENFERTVAAPQANLYAREGRVIPVSAPPLVYARPETLDLTRLDGINLAQRWVTVGGMQFKYDEKIAKQLAEIVVNVVRESVARDLEKALGQHNVVPVAQDASPEVGVLPPSDGGVQAG